jgi:glyceraldehyde 3-phosphate dehydrogenase
MGVNNDKYTSDMKVVSNASCTTNCLAPMVKVVNDKYGIVQGLMTTVHAATSKQNTVDSRSMKDWRIGRSVFGNIIPTSTGAAKACGLVIPEVQGKLTGLAMRIPAADVSIVDLTARLAKPATYEDICAAMKEAADTTMKGIVYYCDEPVVSADFVGETLPAALIPRRGSMIGDDFVKLLAWYDTSGAIQTRF